MARIIPLAAGITALLAACAGCGRTGTEKPPLMKTPVVFLTKASDDLISYCTCERTYIGEPSQMDCPWCGCGWLFLCPKCRRAFTFAQAEEVGLSWEQLAHNDLDGKWGRQPTSQEVNGWIKFMKTLMKDLKVGQQYVYIDGWVFPTDSRKLVFEGWHARHELDGAPQFSALKDRTYLEKTLNSKAYWEAQKIDPK